MAEGKGKKRDIRQASQFVDAIQYVGGIMSVVLVEEYGWTVEEVERLVEKMSERIKVERDT
jgi:hypothetical protein